MEYNAIFPEREAREISRLRACASQYPLVLVVFEVFSSLCAILPALRLLHVNISCKRKKDGASAREINMGCAVLGMVLRKHKRWRLLASEYRPLHDCRHTFVSRLGKATVSEATLVALARWM
jgi:hypothetical protein